MGSYEKQQRLLEKLERPFSQEIRKEKDRFVKEQAKKLYTSRNISANDIKIHEDNILEIFKKHYRKTIRAFYLSIESDVLKHDPVDREIKLAFWEMLLVEWLVSFGLRQASRVASTTAKDIIKLMVSAIEDEDIIDERGFVVRILRGLGINSWRAMMIARTEVGMASSYASKKTAEKIEQEKNIKLLKKWNATEDERTRVNHEAVNGDELPLNRKFTVGGKQMDRPKDPEGGAGNVINCRCVLTYRRVKE